MSIKFQLKPIARALVQMIFRSNLLFFSLFTWFSTTCCFFLLSFCMCVLLFGVEQTVAGSRVHLFFRLVTGVHLHLYAIKTTHSLFFSYDFCNDLYQVAISIIEKLHVIIKQRLIQAFQS